MTIDIDAILGRKKRRPKRLTLSEIDLVSLVDKGDNPEAHVVIHKRAASTPTPKSADPARGDDMTVVENVRRIEKALAAGTDTKVSKADAEAALDLLATAIMDRARAAGQPMSFEKAYCEALDESPTLGSLAVGAI